MTAFWVGWAVAVTTTLTVTILGVVGALRSPIKGGHLHPSASPNHESNGPRTPRRERAKRRLAALAIKSEGGPSSTAPPRRRATRRTGRSLRCR
jgi:hypothetical protein